MDVDMPAVGEATSMSGSQPEEELYCLFVLCQILTDKKNYKLVRARDWRCFGRSLVLSDSSPRCLASLRRCFGPAAASQDILFYISVTDK